MNIVLSFPEHERIQRRDVEMMCLTRDFSGMIIDITSPVSSSALQAIRTGQKNRSDLQSLIAT